MEPLIVYLSVFAAVYLAVLVWIQKRNVTVSGGLTSFFVADRNLKLPTAIATLGATEIGLITIAYNAQKGFNDGFASFHIGIAALIGCVLVGLTGFVVSPIRRAGVLTLPEYYEQRYGRDIRIFGGTVMALAGILNMGLFLKVASLFLLAMLPPELGEISINLLMIMLLLIAVSYTCFGGMQSVISTDIIQFIMLAGGLIAAAIFLSSAISLETVITTIETSKGAAGFNPFIAESFGLDYILWMVLVAGVVSSAIWPTALSRALCIKDDRTTKLAYLSSGFIFAGRMILPAFLGILAFTYFTQNPSDALASYGSDSDLVATAMLLVNTLPEWALALMIIAMFASFMSTQDSYLFCWSSIVSRDILGSITGRSDDEKFQKKWTRIFIILIALFELYWGLIYDGGEDVWDYMAITGSIYFCSGIILLAGGAYWKGATRWGAYGALIMGFSALLSLPQLQSALGIESFSAPMLGFIAIGLSLVGFISGSMLDSVVTKR